MKILVTGGSGRVGRYIVSELVHQGHEVTSLDLTQPTHPLDDAAYMAGNVARAEDVFGAMAYCRADTIVHLAAWPDPGLVPDSRTYSNNVTGTFNVLDAAAAMGLRRVICTSSAQVYGFAAHPPSVAPITEEYPLKPLNSYALSKVAGEEAAAYFSRRGLDVVTFRIMGVRPPEALAADIARADADPAAGLRLLWTRSDARDIARGYRQAIEAPGSHSGIYNLAGGTIYPRDSIEDLFARYSPGTRIGNFRSGRASPLSCEKAERAFGYTPHYQWRVGEPQPSTDAVAI